MMSQGLINGDYCDQDVYILTVVVDNGKGSKVLKTCKQTGIGGGTICLGEGTVGRSMLTWLDIPTVRREIVIMAATGTQAKAAEAALSETLKLNKPNHGILFKIALHELFGSRNCSQSEKVEGEDVMNGNTHQAVFVIVDRGNAEAVIEAAEQAGARGATIINARGAGMHETSKLFAMVVEPEKEIVLMIIDKPRTDSITTAIRSSIGLDQPGRGIMFVVDVAETIGLY